MLVKNLLLWSWRQLELVHSFEVLGVPFSSLDSLGESVGLVVVSFGCLRAERRRQGDLEASLRANRRMSSVLRVLGRQQRKWRSFRQGFRIWC